MTEAVFREDAYLDRIDAVVTAVTERGPVFDRTIFYATGGGQPGDTGSIALPGGAALAVATTVYADETKTGIVHVLEDPSATPPVGTRATLLLDFPQRLRRMRMHTGLHLLSVVLPYPVTGGSIGDAEGRLDFDIPEPNLDRDAIQAAFDALVAGDHAVTSEWITDAELDANPGLVKTMSVKPPRGSGRVRLVRIGGTDPVDLQPCGGTHVRSTGEVGRLVVTKIEKKGKLNRRVRMAFAEDL